MKRWKAGHFVMLAGAVLLIAALSLFFGIGMKAIRAENLQKKYGIPFILP